MQMQFHYSQGTSKLTAYMSLRAGDWDGESGSERCLFDTNSRGGLFKERMYQFKCLPFRLACAPWVLIKTLKPVRLIVYIDNILILAESKEQAWERVTGLIYLLDRSDWMLNPEIFHQIQGKEAHWKWSCRIPIDNPDNWRGSSVGDWTQRQRQWMPPSKTGAYCSGGVWSPQGESPPKGGVATLPTTFFGVACCGSCPRSLRDLRVGL